MSAPERKKLLLVDGHGLAFRAFYAVRELNAPDGTPTNAIVGFFNMFQKITEDWNPDLRGVVFDAPGPTFRHEAYAEYKAGRKPTPPEFKTQLPIILELLDAMGVPVVSREGVEADDVLASCACAAAAHNLETLILSSDKDILQVLDRDVVVLRPVTGISSFRTMDGKGFEEEYGFSPAAMPDYLALLGDSVDNVPGVPGVGEKTAKKLLSDFGTLEGIYECLDELKGALRKKMEEHREQAFRSRELTRLLCDTEEDLSVFEPRPVDAKRLLEKCRALGLKSLAAKFHGAAPVEEEPEKKNVALREVSAEEIAASESVLLLPVIEGKYPLHLSASELLVLDETGGYLRFPGDEAGALLDRPGAFSSKSVLLPDFKEAAACFGSAALSPERVRDFKTAHYLLHPDKNAHLAEKVIPGYESMSLAERGAAIAAEYGGMERELTKYPGLSELMRNVDIPLIPVLVDMEQYGISCCSQTFGALEKDLSERLSGIEEEIASTAGERINLNSPKQVAWLLFEKIGLPAGKKTKTGYSTDISVLEGLSALGRPFDEVPNLLIEHRELSKMLSGFVQPLTKAGEAGEGVIHGIFEPAVTGTGRLSSREPNLQNLPTFGEWSKRVKEGLRPHGEDRMFVAADYSQIELRILAHLCGDKRLLDAFASGRDIHTETASWVFSTEPALVTPELRRVAKMINFGLLYGMSAFGLAQRLAIGRQEASNIVERYFEALPGVKEYLDAGYAEAKERGYTRTVAGRIRPLAEVSVSPRDRDALRRVAVNTPIQGSAADIARKAMIDFARRFPKEGSVRLVLQVHDSLVCECALDEAPAVETELVKIMESAAVLSVPLKVEAKKGGNLAEV